MAAKKKPVPPRPTKKPVAKPKDDVSRLARLHGRNVERLYRNIVTGRWR